MSESASTSRSSVGWQVHLQDRKSNAYVRRERLLGWLCEREAHSGLTAQEIVDVSGLYDGHGRYDRCFYDLTVLQQRGLVDRRKGSRSRWEV